LFSGLTASSASTQVVNAFSVQLYDLNQNPAPDTSSYSFQIIRAAPILIVGDPQIVGIQGQDFQVHGMPDTVFNLVTSPSLQVNALFVYLSEGECVDNFTACFAHPGTYVSQEGIAIGDVRIKVTAGSVKHGLHLSINDKKVNMHTAASILLSSYSSSLSDPSYNVRVESKRRVVVSTPWLQLVLSNSDHFLNQELELVDESIKLAGSKRYVLKPGQRYPTEAANIQLHGLQGQTWKNAEYPSGLEYEGSIIDYQVADNHLFGTDFVFNLFKSL